MKTINGDLIKLALDGKFDVIVHGANCFCTMGSGIAKQIKDTFPTVYKADLKTTIGDKSKLGTYSKGVPFNIPQFIVLNAYTQYRYGTDKRHADYDAIRNVFKLIKQDFHGKRIGYPKIGAFRAGGDWSIISKIIDEELAGEDHTLVLFK